MKVCYNENNPITYKVFLSAALSNKKLETEVVTPDDPRFQTPRRLPVLILDSGAVVFSSNAASLYLFPPPEKYTEEIGTWLNWEATKLMPALVLIGSKPDPRNLISSLLSMLESSLNGKSYIVGESLTVADICLWSPLYPIYTEEKLKSQFLHNCPHIISWMDKISSTSEVKTVIDKLKFKKGQISLDSIIASCWYLPPEIPKVVSNASFNSPTSEGQTNDVTLKEEDLKEALDAWELGVEGRPKPKAKVKPVLPVPGEKNVLITSALPYVNNVPHLGNIIGCVLSADVFARYCRMRNWNTLYVCGTDEYGTATETKALEEGLTPKEICDKYFAIHSEIYKWFNIEFDQFGRTTTPTQTEVVQDIYKACHKNGYILSAEMDQLLCQKCDKFLADRFVEGVCPRCKFEDARGDQCDGCGHLINAVELVSPRCKLCQTTPIVTQSQQLFLDLPKIEDKLSKWMEKSNEGWTANARVIAKSWLKSGLKPRCITRDLKWGIPVPRDGFRNKVFYVWFDAPIGYMSMTKVYTDQWLKWWKPKSDANVILYQFMAKDNVPFHSIMFPATLLASGGDYTLMNHLMATEYLNYEDGKFSKSRGVGVFGNDAKDTGIPSDIFRFYLLYVRPESQDSSFSWNDLATKNNSELLNNLGNFVHRSLTFIEKFYNSCITPIIIGDEEKQLLAFITIELKNYIAALDKGKLKDGIRSILSISRYGNQYMQSNEPWFLVKGSPSEKERAGVVVSFCSNIVGLLTVLLYPYMPETSRNISEQLNLPQDCLVITDKFSPLLPTGHRIGKPTVLFSKIEQSTIDDLRQKYAGRQKSESPVKEGNANKNKEVKTSSQPENSPELIASLEAEVTKQGEKVRLLKSSGADKSVWQPEVQILLELKKKLANAQGVPVQAPSGGKNKNKK